MIYTDDQGSLEVNCFGAEDLCTSAMDLLADQEVCFTRFSFVEYVGELHAFLPIEDLAENTIQVFQSDNGYSVEEHTNLKYPYPEKGKELQAMRDAFVRPLKK